MYFLILLLIPFLAHAKQTVCLNMIVKDEAHVIKRCLDSVKSRIDYWVIVDTGSTDGTQEIIKEHLKDIPGELHQSSWKNFGYNRSEAYDLVKGKGDYILFMDADDWLEFENDFRFENLTKDAYQMWRGTEGFSYLKPQLVKGNLSWKWVGVTHEYLSNAAPHTSETLVGVKYVSGDNGASHHDPQKFAKNVKLLEEGLKDEPNNERYAFYLAESYRDSGNPTKAIEWYLKRIAMGGWEEETFWAQLQVARLENHLKVPFDIVVEAYLKAHRMRPHRPEPIYYLAEYYNQHNRHDLAYECIKGFLALPIPPQKDVLFNEDWVVQWGLPFQLSICSFYIGKHQESLEVCDVLLSSTFLPSHLKEQVEANRKFPLEKIENKKV